MKKEFYIITAILILVLAVISFFLYEQKLENQRNYELEKQELINQEKEIELERQKAIEECITTRQKEENKKNTAESQFTFSWENPEHQCRELYESGN